MNREVSLRDPEQSQECGSLDEAVQSGGGSVALLTGGDDKSYAMALACSLAAEGTFVDFIGSDKLDDPRLRNNSLIEFRNLRGDQRENAPFLTKLARILKYYARLIAYAARARPGIFHILWNNKFETFDRTLLMIWYRICGRRVVLTAHNVNAARRDNRDSIINRLTLRIQYHLCDHIFVHTERMKQAMHQEFGVEERRISVIPFGINDTVPRTSMTASEAKGRLGLAPDELALLFFGQIAPYKGVAHLVETLPAVLQRIPRLRLVIAGKVKKGSEGYWQEVARKIRPYDEHVICRIEHIPDGDVELYFKAADVLVLPYVSIFQSGVPFLAYSFGLPVIATDVGSLREDVIEGKTGFVCAPEDPAELARAIERYRTSDLYRDLERTRKRIAASAYERHSWTTVARVTRAVYGSLERSVSVS